MQSFTSRAVRRIACNPITIFNVNSSANPRCCDSRDIGPIWQSLLSRFSTYRMQSRENLRHHNGPSTQFGKADGPLCIGSRGMLIQLPLEILLHVSASEIRYNRRYTTAEFTSRREFEPEWVPNLAIWHAHSCQRLE